MRATGTLWLVSALLSGLTAVCLVGIFARKADDPRELASWARAHGVVLDDRTRPVLAYFVRLTILLRVVVPLLLMVVALGVWRFWSHRAWRVRRPAPSTVAVAP